MMNLLHVLRLLIAIIVITIMVYYYSHKSLLSRKDLYIFSNKFDIGLSYTTGALVLIYIIITSTVLLTNSYTISDIIKHIIVLLCFLSVRVVHTYYFLRTETYDSQYKSRKTLLYIMITILSLGAVVSKTF